MMITSESIMNKKLLLETQSRLSPELEEIREEENNQMNRNIEQEIECPRCYDIMTLSSEFDRLGYFCEVFSFSISKVSSYC
jgi:hypothetical protein